MRIVWALSLALVLAAAPTLAAEKTGTKLVQTGKGADKKQQVTFFDLACADECILATLYCEATGLVHFELAGVLAKDAAQSILEGQQALTLSVRGKTFDFFADTFSFSQMDGDWRVETSSRSDNAEMFEALQESASFSAIFESQKQELPVTRDVKNWTRACT